MGLTRVSINRPVFILMVILAMVILGGVSFTRINAELFPNINVPIVSISTTYSGAAPEDVDRLVTQEVLDAVSGLANIDVIQSNSTEGRSQVTITFLDTANVDTAAIDVQRRIGAIAARLPADADTPTVVKADPSQQPVLYLAYSGSISLDRLFQYADETIKPRLESQNGVASVSIAGGLQREIQVQIDPTRLRAYDLTLDQVSAALSRENQGVPSGSIDQGRQQVNLRVYGLFQSVDDIRNLTIIGPTGAKIRLTDIASVVDTYKRVTTRTFLNGQEAVSLVVTKQSGSNEIATVDLVRAELARLQQEIPQGTQLSVISDNSIATRNSLSGVEHSLVEAILLTGLVLLVFLHTLRSTFIVLLAIPTSIISTFIFMNFMGFTLNLMSSIALVMVIGVLVDDSIVVLENIFRHLELGETPIDAALKGRSEIGLAAIAITLVDVVVFAPVAFMSGTVGSFFRQFGLVIVTAVLLSLFVSFTLTPMLASRWLTSGHQEAGFAPWRLFLRGFEGMITMIRKTYGATLSWTLRHRWLPVLVAVVSLAAAVAMIPLGLVKFEFIPQSDQGLFTISVELPPGSSLEATETILHRVDDYLATIPEVKYHLTQSGVGGTASGFITGGGARFGRVQVVLVGLKERNRSVNQIIDEVSAFARSIPTATIRAQAASGGGGGGQPIQVLVTGDDPQTIQRLAGNVQEILGGIGGARDITTSVSTGNPETRIIPDRQRLADAGVTSQQIAALLRTSVDGTLATKLRAEGAEEVDVRLMVNEASRTDLDRIGTLPIIASRGGQSTTITLNQVATLRQVSGPTSVDRRNRQQVVTVAASLVGTTPLGDVTTPLNQGLAQLQASGAIPGGHAVKLGGQSEQQTKAFQSLVLALALSVVLEYMLLAALYESFILPFATMFALPLSVIGAFVGLAVSGNTLNLLSLIGVIVLMGLVGKNGILLIDYTNSLRQQGMSRAKALREAGETRLRPILMTSVALVVGLMPLALGVQEGSETYKGMAAVIIGGMISSTVLSLLVVPCMYTYFDDLQNLLVRMWKWRPFRRSAPAPTATQPAARPVARPMSALELEEAGTRS